jgi:hypothetical protein
MTIQLDATSVSTSVDVEAPIERAFRVFTEGIGSWWDPNHHILQAELAEMVFEPYVGGHIIDRGTDGSELEADPAKASEIEVVFTPDGPARTHVVLTHRHLDRHGDGWESMRDAVRAGWSLDAFAAAAAAEG